MSRVRFQRARRWAARVLAGLVLLTALGGVVFLPFAGRYLVAEDPLEHADVIYVLAGARVERWLEAADLHREGWAPRLLLSPGREEAAEARLRARGIRFPSDAELTRDALLQIGVPPDVIDTLPGSLDNTAHEAAALHDLLGSTEWRTIIVVTSKYHTRRTKFAFAREFRGTAIQIRIRASRYDEATPERWWASRDDLRFVISELQKLAAYRLGLAE